MIDVKDKTWLRAYLFEFIDYAPSKSIFRCPICHKELVLNEKKFLKPIEDIEYLVCDNKNCFTMLMLSYQFESDKKRCGTLN